MSHDLLSIQQLKASTEDKVILKGVDLTVQRNEIHAIMGPNGAGKSTIAKLLGGHPDYEVDSGSVTFEGKNLLDLEPHERSHAGLFMSFQYPVEVAGVTNYDFLKAAYHSHQQAQGEKTLTDASFKELLNPLLKLLHIPDSFLMRSLNVGLSGGEKKKNELLQMLLLKPKLSILDETDSGLDIDALKTVAEGIHLYAKKSEHAVILITHYKRLLEYVKPDKVHVLVDGKIVKSGGYELADELESQGYEWLQDQHETVR